MSQILLMFNILKFLSHVLRLCNKSNQSDGERDQAFNAFAFQDFLIYYYFNYNFIIKILRNLFFI